MDDKIEEAVIICLDNSDHMRNEDYTPTRWKAQTHAVSWIINGMGSSHKFGLLTMAGKRAELISPIIGDITRLHQALDTVRVGGECNLKLSLQLAQMVLRHRPLKCTATRVILFSGSPVPDTFESLESIAEGFRKNAIALDVISFGDSPAEMLQDIVNTADNSGSCHFIESTPDDSTLSVSTINILLPDVDNTVLPAPPIQQHTEREPPPVLRMPPPNRVCRRVVVDHTKYAAHRASSSPPPSTLSLSLTLSLSTPRSETSLPNANANGGSRSGGSDRDSRLVLLVPLPSQRNKRIVVEFGAGRSQVSGRKVTCLARKGQFALLLINEDLLQFIWRDAQNGAVEIDLLLHPGEAKFFRVPEHVTAGRVYCLEVSETHKRHFFWMQHKHPSKDEEYCSTINTYLSRIAPPSNPPTGSAIVHPSSSSALSAFLPQSSRTQYHTLNPSDLQQLLSMYSPPLSYSSRNSRSSSSSSSSSSSQSLSFRGNRASSRWPPSTAFHSHDDEGGYRPRWIKNPLWGPNLGRPRASSNRPIEEDEGLPHTTVTATSAARTQTNGSSPPNYVSNSATAVPIPIPVPVGVASPALLSPPTAAATAIISSSSLLSPTASPLSTAADSHTSTPPSPAPEVPADAHPKTHRSEAENDDGK